MKLTEETLEEADYFHWTHSHLVYGPYIHVAVKCGY